MEKAIGCHCLPWVANGFSMDEPTLPHIRIFLQAIRQHTQNPVQIPSNKTTWEQFGINNETKGYAQYISNSLCPFNRDDPHFTINSIDHSTLNVMQSKPQKFNGGEGNEINSTPSQDVLEQAGKQKKRKAKRKAILANLREDLKRKKRNRAGLSESCSLKPKDTNRQTNSMDNSFSDVKTNSVNSLEPLTKMDTNGNFLVDSSKNIKGKDCLSNGEKPGESIPELFSTLKDLLKSNNTTKNKLSNKNVSRSEILGTTATMIMSLERKRAKIKEEISCKKASVAQSCKKKNMSKKITEKKRKNKSLFKKAQTKTMLDKDQYSNSNENQDVETNEIDKYEPKFNKICQTKSRQTKKSPITAMSKNTSAGSFENLVSKSNQKTPNEICRDPEEVKKRRKKEKERIERYLQKKAFMLYRKHWRPRLKKEFSDRTSVEINDLLKSRWNTSCRKTKRRYEKKWQEQCQLRNPSEKSKEIRNKSSRSNENTSTVRDITDRNWKKGTAKLTNGASSGVPGNKKEVEEGNVLNLVNWVQCNHCKIWRILPDNINVDTLPELWFCKMNTDNMHNKCFIAQELSSKKILQERRKKKITSINC